MNQVQKSLNAFSHYYVRDHGSKQNIERLFGVKAKVIPDVVTVLSKFYTPKYIHELKDMALLGVTSFSSIKSYAYMEVQSEEEYFLMNANIIKNLQQKCKGVKLIYNTHRDYQCTKKFQEFLSDRFNENIEILDIQDFYSFIDIVSSSKLVASSRMHSLIIAASYSVEIEPIIRNAKLQDFINEYENRQNVVYYKNQLDESLSFILNNGQ